MPTYDYSKINTGSEANDGTGDPIRDAFIKVNDNFDLIFQTVLPSFQEAQGLVFPGTTNFGIFYGNGAPTISAAKGSLYLRSDGTGTNDRAYINTDGGTTWTALVTVS